MEVLKFLWDNEAQAPADTESLRLALASGHLEESRILLNNEEQVQSDHQNKEFFSFESLKQNLNTLPWHGCSNRDFLRKTIRSWDTAVSMLLLDPDITIRQSDWAILLSAALVYTTRPDMFLPIIHTASKETEKHNDSFGDLSVLGLSVQFYATHPGLLPSPPLALSCRTPTQVREGKSGGALVVAASKCTFDIRALELLLDAGIIVSTSINAIDSYNALILVIRSHRNNIVRMLLQHGADVYAEYRTCHNCSNNRHLLWEWDLSAMRLIMACGSRGVLKIMVEEGVDFTKTDMTKSTPLHYATKYNPDSLVKRDTLILLLANGVDINARNLEEKTAFDYAKMKGNRRLEEFLKGRGAITGIEAQEIESTSDLSITTQQLTRAQKNHLSILECNDPISHTYHTIRQCFHLDSQNGKDLSNV